MRKRAPRGERTRAEQWKAYKLKSKYGMSSEDLDKMLENHHGTCAICPNKLSLDTKDVFNRYNVDHCHETNRVRGLLCTRCNTVLGKVNDDPELLQCMITYLRHSLN